MFWSDSLSGGGYPFYTQESEGAPNFPALKLVNDAAGSFPVSPLQLGTIIGDKYGNFFQYVKMTGTFVEGTVCKLAGNTVGALVTADATGDNIHTFKTNLTAATGVDSEKGNYLFVTIAATSTRLIFKILGNTSGANSYIKVSVKDVRFGRGGYDGSSNKVAGVDTVGANAVVAQIYRPWNLIPTAAATDRAFGVGMGVVTTGNYSLVQVHGLGKVLMVANTDNWVENQLIVTSATAGAAKGPVSGVPTVADLNGRIGTAKMASTAAAGAGVIGAALIDLLGRH